MWLLRCLIIKMSFRKNLTWGAYLKGPPCLCRDDNHKARKICPPRAVCPIINQRISQGELVSPKNNKNNLDRILKFGLSRPGFLHAHYCTSLAGRRGATLKFPTAGNSLEVTKNSGGMEGLRFSQICRSRNGQRLPDFAATRCPKRRRPRR